MAQTTTGAITTCGMLVNKTGLNVNDKNSADMIDADVFNEKLNTWSTSSYPNYKITERPAADLQFPKDVSGSDLEPKSTLDFFTMGKGKNQARWRS